MYVHGTCTYTCMDTKGVYIHSKRYMYIYIHVDQPWHRWLKSWNISMTSERKQREIVRELTDGIGGELVLYSFPTRKRGEVMKQAPCVWVEDLEQKIVDTIEFNAR